ncbi:MAG TPA: LemA family protein [Candidatus Acidoferrum sp.]|nr:LemA family protein [Candidatus Acidoferrum sp.]
MNITLGGPTLNLGLLLANSAAIVAAMLPVAAIAFIAISAIFLYNTLVLSRNRTREAWSGIDVQLKRRSSLIPNLVETVRGYANHEHAVFSEVAQARGALAKATGPVAVSVADQGLTGALGRLMAVAEAYPQLQAAGTFTQLQDELSDTEEKVAYARQFYNRNALDYNTRIQTFPGNQFARWFRFEAVEYFNVEETAKADVKVQFSAV